MAQTRKALFFLQWRVTNACIERLVSDVRLLHQQATCNIEILNTLLGLALECVLLRNYDFPSLELKEQRPGYRDTCGHMTYRDQRRNYSCSITLGLHVVVVVFIGLHF